MKNAKNLLKVSAAVLKRCKLPLCVYILVMLTFTGMSITLSLLNKGVTNTLLRDISAGALSRTFILLAATYMGLHFLMGAGDFIATFGYMIFTYKMNLLFRKLFMLRASQTPQEKFFDNEFHHKFTFINQNLGKAVQLIQNIAVFIFHVATQLIGIWVLFALHMPILLVYALIVLIFQIIVAKVNSDRQYQLSKKQIPEQRLEGYYGTLLTARGAAKELRIFGTRASFLEKWKKFYRRLMKERLSLSFKGTDLSSLFSFIGMLLQSIVLLSLAAAAFYRIIDPGTFVMLSGLVGRCDGTTSAFAQVFVSGAYQNAVYLKDFVDFMGDVTEEDLRAAEKMEPDSGDLSYGPFESLVLKQVSYHYPTGETDAVSDVSLTLRKGEIISILGYNGSGKTTLAKLMTGCLNPKTGSVLLNGRPAAPREIFSYFGIAHQESARYELSMRENVAIGRIEQMESAQAVDAAICAGGLKQIAARLEKGIDTTIGKSYDDHGTELSGGEWQRLHLARAYMGQPEILIMDEPTASIDPLEETRMLSEFRQSLSGRTAVLISHRMAFARLADRIIMMKDGKILEEGTHESLLRAGGYYCTLFEAQKEFYTNG